MERIDRLAKALEGSNQKLSEAIAGLATQGTSPLHDPAFVRALDDHIAKVVRGTAERLREEQQKRIDGLLDRAHDLWDRKWVRSSVLWDQVDRLLHAAEERVTKTLRAECAPRESVARLKGALGDEVAAQMTGRAGAAQVRSHLKDVLAEYLKDRPPLSEAQVRRMAAETVRTWMQERTLVSPADVSRAALAQAEHAVRSFIASRAWKEELEEVAREAAEEAAGRLALPEPERQKMQKLADEAMANALAKHLAGAEAQAVLREAVAREVAEAVKPLPDAPAVEARVREAVAREWDGLFRSESFRREADAAAARSLEAFAKSHPSLDRRDIEGAVEASVQALARDGRLGAGIDPAGLARAADQIRADLQASLASDLDARLESLRAGTPASADPDSMRQWIAPEIDAVRAEIASRPDADAVRAEVARAVAAVEAQMRGRLDALPDAKAVSAAARDAAASAVARVPVPVGADEIRAIAEQTTRQVAGERLRALAESLTERLGRLVRDGEEIKAALRPWLEATVRQMVAQAVPGPGPEAVTREEFERLARERPVAKASEGDLLRLREELARQLGPTLREEVRVEVSSRLGAAGARGTPADPRALEEAAERAARRAVAEERASLRLEIERLKAEGGTPGPEAVRAWVEETVRELRTGEAPVEGDFVRREELQGLLAQSQGNGEESGRQREELYRQLRATLRDDLRAELSRELAAAPHARDTGGLDPEEFNAVAEGVVRRMLQRELESLRKGILEAVPAQLERSLKDLMDRELSQWRSDMLTSPQFLETIRETVTREVSRPAEDEPASPPVPPAREAPEPAGPEAHEPLQRGETVPREGTREKIMDRGRIRAHFMQLREKNRKSE